MERMEKALKEALAQALEEGVTQQELSAGAGVQQASISRFLSGEAGISGATFMRLVVFLGGELTFPGGITARRDEAGDGGELELARLRAELAAEKAMTARLERLLAMAVSGRGAANDASAAPAAGESAQRRAG